MSSNIETMISEVEKLDDRIFELNKTIANKVNALQNKKREMQSLLDFEFAKIAADILKDKDYGCGTATIETERHKVKVVVSKKIKWDEFKLSLVADMITDAGKDPEDYIKYKLSVAEARYKGFPSEVQKLFKNARTIKPSAPKITIERK